MIYPGSGHPIAESLRYASALGQPLVYLCPRRARSFLPALEDLLAQLAEVSGRVYLLTELERFEGWPVPSDLVLDTHCLFPKDTDPELMPLAPVLVSSDAADMVERLFPAFWALGSAVVVVADCEADTLVAQLKRSLYPLDSDGDVCILRFHDPRVMDRLQDVLDPGQRAEFLGEVISAIFYEDRCGAVRGMFPARDGLGFAAGCPP